MVGPSGPPLGGLSSVWGGSAHDWGGSADHWGGLSPPKEIQSYTRDADIAMQLQGGPEISGLRLSSRSRKRHELHSQLFARGQSIMWQKSC